MNVHHATFADLGLMAPLTRQLSQLGYDSPRGVQLAAIPAMLQGRDLKVQANTGCGKTAAFALPLLQRLMMTPPSGPRRFVRTLILTPSRELAMQVGESIRKYCAQISPSPRVLTVYGGVSVNSQMMALRGGADVLVATPGRLLDLLVKNALKLDRLEALVLDEADKLLSLGFADELSQVFDRLPKNRQSALFSATFGDEVTALAGKLLRDPLDVTLAVETDKADISQRVIEVAAECKTPLLIQLIKQHKWPQLLVFANAKQTCNRLQQKLQRAGISTQVFHGDKSQGKRVSVLNDFKQGKLQILIATDIAARGLDIDKLPAVVNYELPRSPADYIHRIGRTGRAGESGVALSLICPDEFHHFRVIEKKHQLRLSREQVSGFELPAQERM
ncbi:MAG: DEAD/DEAH box helicase [Shewanella sp.]|nr:DEAD/DEAH box helicase [Shewanella sp.]MCF1432108.1 DEAD/DEAH box helicase [Shewanella sp.]MCF1456735.1 DEAD/DEAH box helicase [Shewanella sp.]